MSEWRCRIMFAPHDVPRRQPKRRSHCIAALIEMDARNGCYIVPTVIEQLPDGSWLERPGYGTPQPNEQESVPESVTKSQIVLPSVTGLMQALKTGNTIDPAIVAAIGPQLFSALMLRHKQEQTKRKLLPILKIKVREKLAKIKEQNAIAKCAEEAQRKCQDEQSTILENSSDILRDAENVRTSIRKQFAIWNTVSHILKDLGPDKRRILRDLDVAPIGQKMSQVVFARLFQEKVDAFESLVYKLESNVKSLNLVQAGMQGIAMRRGIQFLEHPKVEEIRCIWQAAKTTLKKLRQDLRRETRRANREKAKQEPERQVTEDISEHEHQRAPEPPPERTGCRTCVYRKIHCDEKYPQCQNCTEAGIGCTYVKDGLFGTRHHNGDDTPLQLPPYDIVAIQRGMQGLKKVEKQTKEVPAKPNPGPTRDDDSTRSCLKRGGESLGKRVRWGSNETKTMTP